MQFFRHFRLLFAAITLAPVAVLAAPLSAQSSEAVYEDIVNAIDEGVDRELVLDGTMVVVRREYAAVPEIAMVEQMSPGLIDELMKELRPIFRDYQARVTAMYRPQMANLFAETFTPDEARYIAAFYRSDLGKRITHGVSSNFSPDATLDGAVNFDTATNAEVRKDVEQDLNRTTAATVAEMSRADLLEVERLAFENPELLKLRTVGPKMVTIRAQMELEMPTASEEARIEAVTMAVFERRLGE